MKLKYYLRGLGIGIVVTAFISSIANGIGNKTLATEEIILKAKELGMVTQEEFNEVNSNLSDAKISITDLQNQLEEAKASKEEPESKEDTTNDVETETTETDNVSTKETYVEGSTSESTTVKFSVTPGMSAQAIANLLEEKGVISDANEFHKYIVDTGNVNNLQFGEYEVNSSDSYDTIIRKLTRSE